MLQAIGALMLAVGTAFLMAKLEGNHNATPQIILFIFLDIMYWAQFSNAAAQMYHVFQATLGIVAYCIYLIAVCNDTKHSLKIGAYIHILMLGLFSSVMSLN